MSRHHRPQTGFTLAELVITLGVGAMLVSLAIPGFQSLMADNRTASAVNVLLGHLHLARSEAVRRQQRVVLCPSPDGRYCSNRHESWGKGYISFIDSNGNRRRDGDETLLRAHGATEEAVRIMSSSGYRRTITYVPSGAARGSNTTIRFCVDNRPEANRAIIISTAGRPRASKTMPDGSSISCDGQ